MICAAAAATDDDDHVTDDADADILRLTHNEAAAFLRCSGVYVAAVVHHEGRVLVACDGRVPMVEVVDAASVSDASLTADYYWLLKVGWSVG